MIVLKSLVFLCFWMSETVHGEGIGIQRISKKSLSKARFATCTKRKTTSGTKLFGAPKKIRGAVTHFEVFRELYLTEVINQDAFAFERLQSLLKSEVLVAVMCCEEYVSSHDSCHRFALADEMINRGLIEEADVLHLNMDSFA